MKNDTAWKAYLSDRERFADLVNGLIFTGGSAVRVCDVEELDTQAGYIREPGRKKMGNLKIRDTFRKVRFGKHEILIGIECEEVIDYAMPLRDMYYTVAEYEKQAAEIRRQVRKETKTAKVLNSSERLYHFRRDSRLMPAVTITLYCGEEEWDGPKTLQEMTQLEGLLEALRIMVQNYQIHLVRVRNLKDTSMFHTDVRQVLDFIRFSKDKHALRKLMKEDMHYQQLEEDALDVMIQYAGIQKLIKAEKYYREDGKIDMRTAFDELIEDGRKEGLAEGIIKSGRRHLYSNDVILEDIVAETGFDYSSARKVLEDFDRNQSAQI